MRRDKQGESRQFEPMSWVARVLVVHLMQQGLKRRTETIRSSYGFWQAVRSFLGLLFALLPSTASLV